MSNHAYVNVAELDEMPVRVACSPLPTVFTLTRDALQSGRRGTPAPWRALAISTLRRRDAEALAPLTDRRCAGWPDMLDDNDAPHEALDHALERVASTSSDALLSLLECGPDSVTPGPWWDPVRRDPDRWLRSYVDAIHRAWEGLEPLWRRAAPLLEHEVARIDEAVDRGVPLTQLVADVHTRASLVDGQLRLMPAAASRRLRVDERGVILAPMVVGGSSGIIGTPRGRFARTAYPLRDTWRLLDEQVPPPASLAALLGTPRAGLLRSLDRPRIAGELGATAGLSPSATTFHLHALEAAGLITRERRGRHVLVHRTERGTVLLALYDVV